MIRLVNKRRRQRQPGRVRRADQISRSLHPVKRTCLPSSLVRDRIRNHSVFLKATAVKMEELDKEQIAILRKAFEAFDHEKKGCIGTVMVGTILGMLGHNVTDDMLKEIIQEVDVDGSGELEFEEFVTLASRFMVEEDAEAMQQELKEAFRLYDKEGNGYITTAVLREILRELDDKISAEELDMMIEEIDSDGSGTVDFDEFMEVMTGGDD
ncbi:troponin C-like [Bombyx mandarina]|nr:troponin C-like [Bombyx mandarina]